MLQKQAGHNPMGHVTLVPGVSPVRPRRGAHYGHLSRVVGSRGGDGRNVQNYIIMDPGVGTPNLLPVTLPCSTCIAALAERPLDSGSIVVRIDHSRCFC